LIEGTQAKLHLA